MKKYDKEKVTELKNKFSQQFNGTFQLNKDELKSIGENEVFSLYYNNQNITGDINFLDPFSKETNCPATIFVKHDDQFIRISTTLLNSNKEKVIGTNLGTWHPAYDALCKGEPYLGHARLFGQRLYTFYMPIKDKNNNVIGTWFVGTQREQIYVENEFVNFITQVNRVLASYDQMLKRMQSSGSTLVESALSLNSNVKNVNNSSNLQREKTNHVVSIMNELNEKVNLLFENTNKAFEITKEAETESVSSKQVVIMVLNSLNTFAENLENVNQIVTDLVIESDNMGTCC